MFFFGILLLISAIRQFGSYRKQFKLLGWYRTVCSTTTAQLSTFAGSLVEIDGRISEQSELISSPLSKVPTAWFLLKVDEIMYTKRKNYQYRESRTRRVTVSEARSVFIEDAIGACQLDLTYSNANLIPTSVERTSLFSNASEVHRNILTACDVSVTGIAGLEKTFEFQEYTLPVHSSVCVIGRSVERDGQWILQGTEEEPVLLSAQSLHQLLSEGQRQEKYALWSAIAMFVVGIGLVLVNLKL